MLVWHYHNAPETSEQVEEYLCQALTSWELQLGQTHQDMIPLLNALGVIYTTQGEYEQAELLLRRAVAIQEQQLGEGLDSAMRLESLASHYKKRGKYELAEELYRRSLSLDEAAYGKEHPNVAIWLHYLGEVCEAQGKLRQAEEYWLRAIAIWKQAEGPRSPNAASCHYKLARLYQGQEKYHLAEELYRQAFIIWDRTIRPEYVQEQRKQYASFLRMLGKEEEAKQVEKVV